MYLLYKEVKYALYYIDLEFNNTGDAVCFCNAVSYACQMIATYNGNPFFKLPYLSLRYLLSSGLGDGYKTCIILGFMGKVDYIFIAYIWKHSPVLD